MTRMPSYLRFVRLKQYCLTEVFRYKKFALRDIRRQIILDFRQGSIQICTQSCRNHFLGNYRCMFRFFTKAGNKASRVLFIILFPRPVCYNKVTAGKKAYLACRGFQCLADLVHKRFLCSVNTETTCLVPSTRCLHSSNAHLIQSLGSPGLTYS